MTEIDTDADRLQLLDRIAERAPQPDLETESVEWTKLDDGREALLVNGGGIDRGDGAFFANYREDVHAVGSLRAHVGCVVIRPDGSRCLARVMPDPLAQ